MANLRLTQEKLDALRSEYKRRNSPLKYPRPKTKPEYQLWYPWLLPDEIDPHFVFCTVCECRLSAKRSDLGKHEGSIKHTENAQRKGLIAPPKNADCAGIVKIGSLSDVKWEYNEEQYVDDNMMNFSENIPQEPKIELANDGDSGDGGDGDGVPDEEDDDNEDEGDEGVDYEAMSKRRRTSETDSQHSGVLDFLPLQVTINEPPTNVTLSNNIGGSSNSNLRLSSNGPMPTQYQPSPCRITIKKVTTPIIKAVHNLQPNEITTKATITPIAGSYALSQQQQQCAQQQAANAQHQTHLQQQFSQKQSIYSQSLATATPVASLPFSSQQSLVSARDSFDLFFDSICATVKALPPKLATEGKIRVMQLIGELEMRAIGERESQQNVNNNTVLTQKSTSAAAGQQNATVASTTK